MSANRSGKKSKWQWIHGASETVVGEDMISAVATRQGQASRRGVVYEVANGVRIPNLGEKQFVGVSNEGIVDTSLRRFAR